MLVVPFAKPSHERQHFGVSPHPRRKALEPRERGVGIAVTALAGETFPVFRNEGAGTFRDATHSTGLGPLVNKHSGWGVGWADFNNDGFKDLFAAQSHVNDVVEQITGIAQRETVPDAVVRAAVARAIVAAGLLPSLGIHHRNRSNSFCLADDLIEPLRPLVDDRVRELHRQGYDELNQPAKAALLEILADRVALGHATPDDGEENTGPLMVQLHRYVASLVRCYTGDARELNIPRIVGGVADADGADTGVQIDSFPSSTTTPSASETPPTVEI